MLVNKLLLVILSFILVIHSGIGKLSPPKSLINKAKTAKEFMELARSHNLTYNYQMKDKLKGRYWKPGQAIVVTFPYCAPYQAMHVLEGDQLSVFWPPAVLLPRCSGYLFGQESGLIYCAPTKIVDDHIMVEKITYSSRRKKREVTKQINKGSYHHLMKRSASVTMVSYPVKVHVECREACIQNDKSCAAVGKIFDSAHCECKCNSTLNCNIPYKLDNHCNCVCSLSDSDCNADIRGTKYLNKTSCQCECNVKSRCLPPNILTKDDCNCIRPNIQARVAATASTCVTTTCPNPKKPRFDRPKCKCVALRRTRKPANSG